MSVKSAVEQLAEPIGKEIGASDDFTQSALLNGFFHMLKSTCRGHIEYTSQLAFIADKLSTEARIGIAELSAFCQEGPVA